ncbi:MAG TPA: type II toxin-antitoxin system VapC family toxin [Solirubrobacteraceae bacterium]|jgi:predicted nucleic acid-binding protein|nr:type II toxin-antitoxin system VapC family toxin [Solirubrobacteraceae bacterium]
MLVVDANVVVEVTLERFGVTALDALGDEQLVAPWLLWSEVPAALSAMVFRAEISRELGESALARLETIKVEPLHPDGLITEAWRIAKERGWAKTYDAEYLALARLLGCRLVTLDGPLWRATRNLGYVVTPEELKPPTGETSSASEASSPGDGATESA